MAEPNANFSTLLTTTLQNYKTTLTENIMGRNALLWQLQKRGFVKEDSGGRSIVIPILYGTNSTIKSYRGYDLLDVTPQVGFTSAEYEWKYIAGSITISGQEEFENQGKGKIVDLLDGKITQAEISMRLAVNQQLFADGTANSGKDLTGLALAVEDGTAWSTYAGIDSSATVGAFWRNQWLDLDTEKGSAGVFSDTKGKSTWGLELMRRMFNLCLIDGAKPSLIVTTRAIYEAYEAEMEGAKLRLTDVEMGDAGFQNIMFKGIPLVFDDHMQAEEILFLNSDHLKFVIGKGRNFTTTPFVKPENQDAKVANILLAGNVVTNKRDVHGRITRVTV